MSHFFETITRDECEEFYGFESFRKFLNVLLLPYDPNIKRTFSTIIAEMCTQRYSKTRQLNIDIGWVGFRPRNGQLGNKRPGIVQDSLNDLRDFYEMNGIGRVFTKKELEFYFGMEDRFGSVLTTSISIKTIIELRSYSNGGRELNNVAEYDLGDLFYEKLCQKFEVTRAQIDEILNDIYFLSTNGLEENNIAFSYIENMRDQRRMREIDDNTKALENIINKL